MRLVESLVAALPVDAPSLFNPWRQSCEYDAPENTLAAKKRRLAHHLDCDARWILIGEAPGYQGCRYSGVAFTSEKLLMDGTIPRIAPIGYRVTRRERAFKEPSARVVWDTLHHLGIAEDTVLWNALQLHPFQPGRPFSNRTPLKHELAYGVAALEILLNHFRDAKVVAVGKKADAQLSRAGVSGYHAVRHPSMGGASKFTAQLGAIALR